MNVALPKVASRANWIADNHLALLDIHSVTSQIGHIASRPYQSAMSALRQVFDQSFSLIDTATGEVTSDASSLLSCDFSGRLGLLSEVAKRGVPEIIEDESPLLMLAIPLKSIGKGVSHVAVGVMVTQMIDCEEKILSAARVIGVDSRHAFQWSRQQEVWPPAGLIRIAKTTLQSLVLQGQLNHLKHEINEAVAHARDTYVELSLLHRLAQNLDISENESELWGNVLKWLADAIPAQCMAIIPNEQDGHELLQQMLGRRPEIMVRGQCPLETNLLGTFILELTADRLPQPLVLNRSDTALPTWNCAMVRELACVPIEEGEQILGWIVALNHRGDPEGGLGEFGSVEARLMSSIATILGIHGSNLCLYHKQEDLFASSIQALTSAIDAKDNYTSGHSERVAKVSVRLAQWMDCSEKELNTIYIAGLLHDIGKIGIDDQVLSNPGKLTPEEYDHIKRHPQLGFDILKGVRQLERVLPVVLHHHEAFNGKGYPGGLLGEETPLLARIVSVADAFDAMASDRPYRKGMPDEKIDMIFREGAGSQWDRKVVEAFFSIREEIRNISHEVREAATLGEIQPAGKGAVD